MPDQPMHPLYVVSKGRSQFMMTFSALTEMRIPHYGVIETQEVPAYKAAIDSRGLMTAILELDPAYKLRYDLCDHLGHARSTGPGPARNAAWDHSISLGAKWHWVLDDNIRAFYRLNRNRHVKCINPAFFRVMEDFCSRYRNVAMAGPQYTIFAPQRAKLPPYYKNTRIYSCILIRNDVPFRWRCRYNEDTILALDMLKAGWCTIEFNAFLQGKVPTQTMPGGNTTEFYHREGIKGCGPYVDGGTVAKSNMLARVHPDVARVTWKFGRVHHQVNYRPFKSTPLILRKGLILPAGTNEYGMTLRSL